MLHNLNVSLGKPEKVHKLPIYTEDHECAHFIKAILGRKFSNLEYPDIKLGCGNLLQLGEKKVPSFTFPNSIVVLDGDAQNQLKKKRLKNYLCLPGQLNPESMLANFLSTLPDASPFWTEKSPDYSKQVCFRDYSLQQITSHREIAKKWYNQQLKLEANVWGRQANLLFKYFLPTIVDEKSEFLTKFEVLYNNIYSFKK